MPDPPVFDPLHNADQMAGLIAQITSRPTDEVMDRLQREYASPCSTVAGDFKQRGAQPYVWSRGMNDFYSSTDAFLYELAVWNRNAIKLAMRRWITTHIGAPKPKPLDVLTLGDGLGFDSLELARAGHRVTYFELPGLSARFAEELFRNCHADIRRITRPDEIPPASFDVVVCLDVLEHVPDPGEMVGKIASYLRPTGRLLVHAPFYMIHPTNPTHLAANRRHSGSLSLYRRHHLACVGGSALWTPLVLHKSDPATPVRHRLTLAQKIVGLYYRLGRKATWPMLPIVWYRKCGRRWFD